MLLAIIILLVKIKENKLVEEAQNDLVKGEEESTLHEKIDEQGNLSKKDKKNFYIIIVAVFLWFMAFNAVETFMSTYFVDLMKNAGHEASKGVGIAGQAVIVLTISSILVFIPASHLASKIGRKWSVCIGLLLLILGFGVSTQLKDFNIIFILAISICGIGWAMINVNSYPMILEMSNQNNIGKITGIYYVASMLAQSVTPVLLGIIMTLQGHTKPLFYYSLGLSILAFIIFVFFKENNCKKNIKTGLEAFDVD